MEQEVTAAKTQQQTGEARNENQADIIKVGEQQVSQENRTKWPSQGQETVHEAKVEPQEQRSKEDPKQEVGTHEKAVEPPWVTDLLVKAKTQIEAKRLIKPQGDNALETYQKILHSLPCHKGALIGINKLKEQYKKLAEKAGDQQNADEYRNNTRKIDSLTSAGKCTVTDKDEEVRK